MRELPTQRADPSAGAERAMLLHRAAAGLAHEGKNPLHTMALHLHLLTEKLAKVAVGDVAERHLGAVREGIAKVDALLRAFADLATPGHLEPDLAAALERAVLLFGYELRRGGSQLAEWKGPRSARVETDGAALGDLVTHAFLAALTIARGGGTLSTEIRCDDRMAHLVVRAEGGVGESDEAAANLDALRRLALDLQAELSIAASTAGSARLSISLPCAR